MSAPLEAGIAPGTLVATTPEGTVPVDALRREKRSREPSAAQLAGIALVCLVAGILATVLVLRLLE